MRRSTVLSLPLQLVFSALSVTKKKRFIPLWSKIYRKFAPALETFYDLLSSPNSIILTKGAFTQAFTFTFILPS
jgi:hypothetical protein